MKEGKNEEKLFIATYVIIRMFTFIPLDVSSRWYYEVILSAIISFHGPRYKPQIKDKNSSESSFFCPDSFTDNFILEIKYLNKNVFGRNTNYFWLILTTSVQSVWVRHWEMEYFFCFLKQITVFIQNSFKSQIDGYCSKCVAWLTFVYIPIINIPPNVFWMVNRNSEIIF